MKENKKLDAVVINNDKIYLGDFIRYKNESNNNIYLANVSNIFVCNDNNIYLELMSQDYRTRRKPLQLNIDSFSNDVNHRDGNRTIIDVRFKHKLQDNNSIIISYY